MLLQAVSIISLLPRSVPVLGIIFLSVMNNEYSTALIAEIFPSPYWGLFFIISAMTTSINNRLRFEFPSPYWGLFFLLIVFKTLS